VKYSRDHVAITVKAYAVDPAHVAVAITDAGVGIPRNQLKRVFQRFYRVGNETTRIRKGTGLGLYIVKETLKGLGGHIRATSPGENQGSTFTVTLPGGT
jgi:signal transduction histidine kinase